MKKILCFLVLLLVPVKVFAISASSYIAYDLDNDIIYYEKNADDKKLIASITKILTAIVTIENVDINKYVEVSDEVLKAYGSAIYIEVGEKLTIKDLLYGLMLRSGNDAAVVLAKNVAGNNEKFASLMNKLATDIGMKNSYFINPHGLEENDGSGNTSTARDMALLTKYAMKNKIFREIFGTKKYTVKTNYKTYSWTNKNKLLLSEDYITGGKTGFTKKARRTLVTTGSRNNINVVIVTLNDGNDFLDHKNMYEEIFRKYKSVKVLDKNNIKIKNEKLYKGNTLYLNNDIYVSVLSNKDKIEIDYNMYDKKRNNDNDVVGKVIIKLNGKVVRVEDILLKVNEKNIKHKSWWIKLKEWLKW